MGIIRLGKRALFLHLFCPSFSHYPGPSNEIPTTVQILQIQIKLRKICHNRVKIHTLVELNQTKILSKCTEQGLPNISRKNTKGYERERVTVQKVKTLQRQKRQEARVRVAQGQGPPPGDDFIVI